MLAEPMSGAAVAAQAGVRASYRADSATAQSSRLLTTAALLAAAVLLSIAGVTAAAPLTASGPDQAAAQTGLLARHFAVLSDSDFTETLFPVAIGVAGRSASNGTPRACGVVISGIDGSAPQIRWQRSFGSCAESHLGRVNQPLPAAEPGARIAVEVLSRDGYALSQTIPDSGTLPQLAPTTHQ